MQIKKGRERAPNSFAAQPDLLVGDSIEDIGGAGLTVVRRRVVSMRMRRKAHGDRKNKRHSESMPGSCVIRGFVRGTKKSGISDVAFAKDR